MITLDRANDIARKIGLETRIVRKIGLEIRKASSSEIKKDENAFDTVSEAFRYLCKREFEKLQETELTQKQRELVKRAVYDEEI